MGLIFLTGMTGAGKTAAGEKLGARLGVPFIDLDARVAKTTGRRIPQIFAEEGEAAFREQEALALRRVARIPEGVVSLGGGTLERQANFELVHAHGMLIYLRAPIDLLAKRLFDSGGRPLLAGEQTIEGLEHRLLDMLAQREARYMTAQIIVDLDETTALDDIVDKLCRVLKPQS